MVLKGEAKRAYQLEWVKRRRQTWIDENGPCAICHSKNDLEVDHIDASTKLYDASILWGMAINNPKRIAELAKCQVLCSLCHASKSTVDNSKFSTQTHCYRNHELTKENTYIHPKAQRRECLICKKLRRRMDYLHSQ